MRGSGSGNLDGKGMWTRNEGAGMRSDSDKLSARGEADDQQGKDSWPGNDDEIRSRGDAPSDKRLAISFLCPRLTPIPPRLRELKELQ